VADTNRIARLHETLDEDELGPIATGLFQGAIEALGVPWPDGDAIESPIPLPDALEWAWARADRVSVIADDQVFSAGRVPLADPPLDEGRIYERRRHVLWWFVDRSEDDPPISWDVVVELDARRVGDVAGGGELNRLGERWRGELEASAGCRLLAMATSAEVVGNAGDGWTAYVATPMALMRLEDRTHAGAGRAAVAVAEHAARSAGWEPPPPTFSVDGAYPTGSRLARRNAHL
jgi:hypothetical protein